MDKTIWAKIMVAVALLTNCEATSTAPKLLAPATDATVYTPHPHFSWSQSCLPVAIDATCSYVIELRNANHTFRSSTPAVITRFVPTMPLSLDRVYEWRIGSIFATSNTTQWSEWRSFVTKAAASQNTFIVQKNATFESLQTVFQKSCENTKPVLVRFEPRGLNFEFTPPNSTTAFATFDSCTAPSIVLDFNSASLTFKDVRMGFFAITNCSDIIVRDLALDLHPLPYSAMRLDSVSNAGTSFVGTLMPGHPEVETLDITTRNTFELVDPLTTRTARGLMEAFPFSTNWQRLNSSSDSIRYNVTVLLKNSPLDHRDVGRIAVFGERTGQCGFAVSGGARITFSNVTVYACANECFTSSHTTQLSILRGGIVLRPGRFKAANDGGHNHHSSRIGAWVSGARWESTGDDICHFSALVMSAEQRWDGADGTTTLRLRCSQGDRYCKQNARGANSQVRVGDVMQFFNRSAGAMITERSVVGLKTVPASPSAAKAGMTVQTVITLAAPPLPALDLGKIGSDQSLKMVTNVFSLNATASQFVFRNNSVVSGRRFGVLAKGHRLLIDRNSFVGLGSGAVNYLNSVTEGLCARAAVFANNIVVDALQLAQHGSAPTFTPSGALWADVLPSVEGTSKHLGGARCHQDLLFSNNTIDSGPHPFAKLYDVGGARLSGNRVTRCSSKAVNGAHMPWAGGFDTMHVSESDGVVSGNNTVLNSTAAPLCTKRAQLIKTANASEVYWIDFRFEGRVEIASGVLHKLKTCDQCGTDLCESMGIAVVPSAFVASRHVSPIDFNCGMLGEGRVLLTRIPGTRTNATLYYQADPKTLVVHRMSRDSCVSCPGAVCLNPVLVDPAYAATLQVSALPFRCSMASGRMDTWWDGE